MNLNFESANLSPYGVGPAIVPVTDAIPGWTAYISGAPQTDIAYNGASLGGAQINIESAANPNGFPTIQGNYFIWLEPNSGGSPSQSAAIGQTGQIPASDESLTFWGNYNGALSFDGEALDYTQIGTGSTYSIYAADISSFDDETGQLLFTASFGSGGFIDNIQFSPDAVPEPGELALMGFGGAVVVFTCRKRSR